MDRISVLGAGLVGSLISNHLARLGFEVELFERRPDMRVAGAAEGRSINLAVSTRGLHALREVGLEAEVLAEAIPMQGRMIHSLDGNTVFQPYGLDASQCIHSISRAALNRLLMTAAESSGRVHIFFEQRAVSADLPTRVLHLHNDRTGEDRSVKFSRLLGTDGSGSVIRSELAKRAGSSLELGELDYGYKELNLPAPSGGGFALEKNALHIWPRGTFMLIALPNLEGSFTCTLFLPFEGPISFAELKTPGDVERFFRKQFPDALALIPDLPEQFFAHPTGRMTTVKCFPWSAEGRALVLGDAAHAIVPFFGQGMNCGFEDCHDLSKRMANEHDWTQVFSEFETARKPNTDAIADMAIENFIEMRDKVADPHFRLEKEVEKVLMSKFPGEYVSRYSLVSFSRVPYRTAFDVGRVQESILKELCSGLQRADDVDLSRALALIRSKLTPVLTSASRH